MDFSSGIGLLSIQRSIVLILFAIVAAVAFQEGRQAEVFLFPPSSIRKASWSDPT
jgi:hypothetical protein